MATKIIEEYDTKEFKKLVECGSKDPEMKKIFDKLIIELDKIKVYLKDIETNKNNGENVKNRDEYVKNNDEYR